MPRSLRKPSYIPSNPIEIFFLSIQISPYLNFINLGTSPPWCVNFQLKSPHWSKSAKNFVFSVKKGPVVAVGTNICKGSPLFLHLVTSFPLFPSCHLSPYFLRHFFSSLTFFLRHFFQWLPFSPSVIPFFSSGIFFICHFFHPLPFSTISFFLPNVSLKLGRFTPDSSKQEI